MYDNTNYDLGCTLKLHSIEINKDFEKAIDLLENTGKNVFITGKAGTGKSTLLEYFRSITTKTTVTLAPTGVAALNVKGETIHSFFGFKPATTLNSIKKLSAKKSKLYKKIDMIIIDEISMVRADLLDIIDVFMKKNGKNKKLPFGGTQMVFFGDLYQLPPVVTTREKEIFNSHYKSPYFFDAGVFKEFSMEFLELEKIYRQKDRKFIELLNSIRNNSVNDQEIQDINKRYGADFINKKSRYHVYLTTTNDTASKINTEELTKLKSKLFSYTAETEGNFDSRNYPTDKELKIKTGSQVMLLNNDPSNRWVNGTIGRIIEIVYDEEKQTDAIMVELPGKEIEAVFPYKWEIFHFRFNEKTETLETEEMGHFIQYPLKLSWAITIHKSQGKTFEKVIIDVGRGTFAHGQMYVALSRCTSLEGIVLKKPIKKPHILMDWRVVQFVTKYQYALSERDMPLDTKIQVIEKAIKEEAQIEVTYLKPNDIKTKRIIKPYFVGENTYSGKKFLGVNAFCLERNDDRVFKVDRILEIRTV